MNNKEQEYREYIINHINNVKRAFQVYGELLCNELEVDLHEMQNQINEHDESKWSAEEFDLYRAKYHTNVGEEPITDYEFNKAWLHHIHNNPHHPQHWVYYDEDKNSVSVYDMPDNYIIEMLCDWIAMGYTHSDTAYSYYHNGGGKNKLFTKSTRYKVEYLLNKIKDFDDTNNL